jgi:hypothetical protein
MNGAATGLKYNDTDDTLWDSFTIEVSDHVNVMMIWE